MTYTAPTFIHLEFDALPSDAVQGIISLPELQAGDILLTIFPKFGPNPGVSTFFENVIATDEELMQTGGSWELATPTMVAVFFRP